MREEGRRKDQLAFLLLFPPSSLIPHPSSLREWPMSNHALPTNGYNVPPSPSSRPQPALPDWLASGLLHAGEAITWVRGPRWNPSLERYITHPALFLVALAVSAAGCWAARLLAGSWSDVPGMVVLVGAGLVLASILVLAI